MSGGSLGLGKRNLGWVPSKCQCVHPIFSFCFYDHLSSHSCSFIASLDSISLPNIVREVLSHPSRRSFMVEEMQALNDSGT